MDASMAQSTELSCPQCHNTFTAEIWLIVDAGARTDLLARAQEDTLHDLPCPHCQHQGQADAPLLLYLPDRDPPLLFSPAQRTNQQQDQQHAARLVSALAERLGEVWADSWLADGLQGVPRALLQAALSDDPEAALQAMAAQRERKHRRMPDDAQQDEPDDATRETIALWAKIRTFLEAGTWPESRLVVEQYPVLLSDEADLLLDKLMHSQENEDARRMVAEHRALLRRCREVGVNVAFAEKTEAERTSGEG